MKVYVIPGNPVALARPRFARSRIFDSQKAEKLVAMLALENIHAGLPAYDKPLHLDITFFMVIPKSHNKRSKKTAQPDPHSYKPDLDNLIKLVGDVGTKAGLWKDDCIIASIESRKIYDANPRTEFTVKVL